VIDDVARSVARALPDATADEIADILWLARARHVAPVRPDPRPGAAAAAQREQRPSPRHAAGTPPREPPREPPRKSVPSARGADDAGEPAALLSHGRPTVPGARSIAATAVGLRAPESMAGPLTTGRMFSPFRRIRRPGPWEVDVDATVEATADARWLTIVTRPARERGLDVALVADVSPVMSAYRDAVAELESILIRAGSFRSVSRWTLSPRAEDVLVRDRAGAEHLPDRLADPSGRRLVLLVTDATADHWYRPGLWRAMRDWAELMPTAVLHVLPEQYRTAGPLGGSPITVRSPRPAAPNRAADVAVPWWSGVPRGTRNGGIPIPVVGLVPSELGAWARAVAMGTGWVEAIWAQQPSGRSAREANAELTIEDRVRAFQVRASRGAQALARILAEAPVLSPPLMSVLQSRLLPETGLSELAEVLVSGLLEQSPSRTASRRDGPFRFRPAASDLLRRGTTADQQWDTFQAISEYLEQSAGTGGSILALIADPRGLARVDPDLEPFAAIGRAVAARLGIAGADTGLVSPGERGDAPVPRHASEPRAQPRPRLALEALVISNVPDLGKLPASLSPERRQVLKFCHDWKSVAEISAALRIPLDQISIMATNMRAEDLVRIHQPGELRGRPDAALLGRVLDGLRASERRGPAREIARDERSGTTSVKVVVAGGFGAGKSTFINSVSEITPLRTEAIMTSASEDLDDLSLLPDKNTMTAVMDFGRITLAQNLLLYVYGTPGVPRLWFLWDDLIHGAIGALVLVNPRRLADSFPAVDYFESAGMPFVIGINTFHGQMLYALDDLRTALNISPSVPVITCDARIRDSAKEALVILLEHAVSAQAPESAPNPGEP
jgi:signal recognition particle receptor subunit beta